MESHNSGLDTREKLEYLRNGLRGSDAAVLEIGSTPEKEKLLTTLKDPEHHSREEVQQLILENFSGEAFGDYQWSKKTGGWGTPAVPTLYGTFRDKYPQFSQLSLDVGLMCHLSEFLEMLENGEIKSNDHEGARNELKEKLGYKVMYRGTMLTDDEFKSIQETGIMSPLSKHVKQSDRPKEEFEAKAISTRISEVVESHFHGEHRASPYMSVSSYEDVAIAVGRHFGEKDDNKKFYLFKLKIPAIDVISYKEDVVRMPYKLKESIERNPDFHISISVNESNGQYKWDEDVESYVFWKLDPKDIVEVTQPDVKESSWNGRKTSWA
jgi:hypothetical protein